MEDSSSADKLPQNSSDPVLSNRDLERMLEDIENISVQLTWMVYDMVALRSSPELGASLQRLEEAHHRCTAAVSGDPDQETGSDNCPDPADTTLTQM